MNSMQRKKVQSVAISIAMVAMLIVLAGCEQTDQTFDSPENGASVDQSAGDQRPLEHMIDFNGFTLRANVSRTDVLPEAMARKYGIEPASDLFLLNLVILENRPDRQPDPVSAEVSAHHESLSGHAEAIDMREVETDGHVSYIGILDASAQRFFQLVIEAQPAGTDKPLHMTFEVQLEAFETDDFE